MTVFQRCWYWTVRDQGPEGFVAEANYADTTADRSLILEVERKTLAIKSAVLEVHRGQPGAPATAPVSALEGITAYFGCGRQLRQALTGNPDLLEMAVQTVSAVIQAEAFFYAERGFASGEVYDDFWDETYVNACVYYSNLNRVSRRFSEYIKDQRRGANLFHRYMLTAIEKAAGEKYIVRGHLMDSFHEMGMTLELDPVQEISHASAAMLRCPDPICREALVRLDSLKGTSLAAGEMKRYNAACGGAAGCTHIAHLVQEAAYAFDSYIKHCAC